MDRATTHGRFGRDERSEVDRTIEEKLWIARHSRTV